MKNITCVTTSCLHKLCRLNILQNRRFLPPVSPLCRLFTKHFWLPDDCITTAWCSVFFYKNAIASKKECSLQSRTGPLQVQNRVFPVYIVFPHRENPVFITGDENRFFPVRKTTQCSIKEFLSNEVCKIGGRKFVFLNFMNLQQNKVFRCFLLPTCYFWLSEYSNEPTKIGCIFIYQAKYVLKGQFISKYLFGVFQKMNKKNWLTALWYLKSFFFAPFLRNWRHQKDISKLTDL